MEKKKRNSRSEELDKLIGQYVEIEFHNSNRVDIDKGILGYQEEFRFPYSRPQCYYLIRDDGNITSFKKSHVKKILKVRR